MSQDFFYGGKPTALLRIANAMLAIGILGSFIWQLNAGVLSISNGLWQTRIFLFSKLVVSGLAFVQAIGPVRFLWPGWFAVSAVIFGWYGTSILSLIYNLSDPYEYLSDDRFRYLTHDVLALLISIGFVLALAAWKPEKPAPPKIIVEHES